MAVTVVIKLRGKEQPILLHRSYLPVIKQLGVKNHAQNAALYEQMASKKVQGKIEMGPLYDYQLNRIYALFRILNPTGFDFKTIYTKAEGCYDAAKILSNDYLQNGGSLFTTGGEGPWYFEWAYDKAKAPWGYEFTNHYRNGSPCSWKLMAKLNEGDEWTVIDEHENDSGWIRTADHAADYTDVFVLKEKDKPYRYYRWEVTKINRKVIQLGGNPRTDFNVQRFNLLY